MKNKSILLAVFFCIGLVSASFAQTEEKFDFYTRGEYRTEVPRPQAVLRYDVGDMHTTYAQMEAYINAVAKAAPDRVRVFDIGLTNEYRMQHIVAISSPQNIARLDDIKAANARLTDPRATNASDANQIVQNNPAIAWMAYTIHGNESASFEAMMQVVYQLSASNEPTTLDILNNEVTLVVTGENPDGHERFVTWYNSVATGNADRFALEHREPWSIYGRVNHYRFDLNRDNIAATQKETQNMQKAFFEWNPQLAVDHHGQPSQYFFPPTALPINPNLPQPVTNRWMDIFGRANAAAFDRNKWDYYNRDIFDLYYPGYWDSMPSMNGAVGMTYETDGGGFKGLRWTRDDGSIVTLRSAIAKHFIASMTTLETLAKNKAQRLQDFYDFRRNALAENIPMKRIVIDPSKDPVKAAEMIEVLLRMRVEVNLTNSAFTSTRAHSYEQKNAPVSTQTCSGNCFVIDLNQPQKKLIKALLEQDTPQDDAFVRDEMAKFKRNEMRGKSAVKEDYRFYDITAWTMPLAFGIDAFWTEDTGAISATRVTQETIDQLKRGTVSGRAQIAYIIPYDTDGAGAMAIRLLKEGFRVNCAIRTMNAGGRNWKRGTFVVRVTRNPEAVHEAVNRLSRDLGVNVTAVNTGYADEGDTPIGGENVYSLTPPRIAIVADEGVDQTSYGSIWWTLDRYGIQFTPMTIANVKGGALKNYNILIMPDGAAGRYFSAFGSGGISGLKEWVQNGGTLITVRGASVFAALKDVGLTSSKLVGSEDDEEKGKIPEDDDPDKRAEAEAQPSPSPTPRKSTNKRLEPEPQPRPTPEMKSDKQDWQPPVLPPIASPSSNAGKVPEGIPGAIMRATVDRTTYLTYGLEQDELPVLLSSGYFFRFSKEGTNALIFEAKPKKPLTISGFVWEGNTEKLLRGTAALIDEPNGGGHVILFADEPFFRGIFRSVTRPFFNAMLFNNTF